MVVVLITNSWVRLKRPRLSGDDLNGPLWLFSQLVADLQVGRYRGSDLVQWHKAEDFASAARSAAFQGSTAVSSGAAGPLFSKVCSCPQTVL